MKTVVLDLSWLDIIFITLALISLGFNIWQYVERKKTVLPLKSLLTALFNDIKAKSMHAYTVRQLLYAEANPHKELETIRWDYYAFTNAVLQNYQGFQEIVVGLLVSLDPSDKDGKEAFKAFDYGLNDQEKEQRKKFLLSSNEKDLNEE